MEANDLEKLLKYDPIAQAEQDTGSRWDKSKLTQWVGLANAIEHGQRKDAALLAAGDTRYGTPFTDHLAAAADSGFHEVLTVPFASTLSNSEERLVVLWDGAALLVMESFSGNLNEAKVSYNLRLHDPENHICESGCYEEPDLLSGYHYVREAMRFTMAKLRAAGDFIAPWKYDPWVWLVHHMDAKGVSDWKLAESIRNAAMRERYLMLPDDVRVAIAVCKFAKAPK